MNRLVALLLMLGLCMACVGCPSGGGGDDSADGNSTPNSQDGSSAASTAGGGNFNEGIDSGRAEDGSDEDR